MRGEGQKARTSLMTVNSTFINLFVFAGTSTILPATQVKSSFFKMLTINWVPVSETTPKVRRTF